MELLRSCVATVKIKTAGRHARPTRSLIVTQVEKLGEFYPAEDYHVNYYNENSSAPYCSLIISPKLGKLREKYGERLK